jgi:RNA recognition motif-containing protein
MSQQSKIYAGNLSYDTKEADLEEFFAQYGKTSEVKLIKDNTTGRSKGFAFITFENQKDAEASLEANGAELQGRKIRVNIARDNGGARGGRGGARGGRGGFGGGNGGGGNWNNRERY